MDHSSLGFAWGRMSHRRTRSGDPSNNAPPIEFTSEGTKYTLESETPLPKSPAPQHTRSKSWSTSKEKTEAAKRQIFFQFADYPNYKAALTPPNPLELRRAASSSKGSHYSHKTTNSTSSVSTKNTSLYGSPSSIEVPQKPFPATPPQRPPRPARGLFEDDFDEEPAPVADDMAMDHTADENIQGLIFQSDQAYEDVGLALADATYSAYVAQAKPDMLVLSRGNSVRRRRQGLTPPVTARRNSIQSNRSMRRSSIQSAHSSTKGHIARPPTTKKMGKRNVLLPRKLRLTLSQSVSDLLTSRASKRVSAASSLSSVYSEYLEEHPSHKRNSSITAAKRLSGQQSKRFSMESRSSLYATDGSNLTASQMYHREMLPNSVMAWMGADSIFGEPDDMDEDDDEELSHEFEDKCNLAPEPELSQLPGPADAVADERPLSVEGSPPPPPPKNPARFGARTRTSQLAPIPEMLVASAEGERRRRRSSLTKTSPKSKRSSGKTKAVPRDSLYLIGTAYSKASPLFRHGHIEFQKSPKLKTEDADELGYASQHVDWLKFHSSILCDAGDLDSGLAQDEANAMADELGDWFDEFGFESHGALIKSGRPRKSRKSSSMESSRSSASSSSTISDADLPMPASPERSPFARMQSWSFGQAERNASAPRRDEHSSDPIPVVTEMELGLNTYGLPTAEEASAKQVSRRVSGARMSCNLSEDLGQFLAWNPTQINDIHEEDE
ncbi:hypothetical protein PWT90_06915 [Aphanocladium album]|nr:hypothetical protein PWT90_06915 [Aphanocladium album]